MSPPPPLSSWTHGDVSSPLRAAKAQNVIYILINTNTSFGAESSFRNTQQRGKRAANSTAKTFREKKCTLELGLHVPDLFSSSTKPWFFLSPSFAIYSLCSPAALSEQLPCASKQPTAPGPAFPALKAHLFLFVLTKQ